MPSPSPAISVSQLVQRAARACTENKADRVVILDLHGVADMTDYFVIANGTSDTHVRALAAHVMEELAKVGQRPYHEEGLTTGRWVLLDYVDFVVHLFHPSLREFYQLERLWGDAETIPVAAQGAGA
jgi:ribosome-associated protein